MLLEAVITAGLGAAAPPALKAARSGASGVKSVKSGVRRAGGGCYARFRQSATGDPQGVAGGGCNGKQQSVYSATAR
ncbi:hypothetical protein LTSEINV_0897 [Salmonella enterica subsp. enterica serovar Inverness str. R8-3668]|uniref:Uncharacterized protein n=1 Tax=Salmonella enterica subsp. enterica serovar Inverness str. R8-3668 TaxID=913075 RepID=G5N959_SALET|nr:hypothetical protein LTSEINV_0897 [Salmonella enterica subsp. enterica serovar Inverness str. R8-3668]